VSENSVKNSSQGENTRGINDARPSAIRRLDDEFRDRLRGLVRREMGRRFRRYEDSEDVVQQALIAFYGALSQKRVQIHHTGSLWPLLKRFTLNKVKQRVEYWLAQIRDIRKVGPLEVDLPHDLRHRRPTEEDAVDVVDAIEAALRQLLRREDVKSREIRVLLAKLRDERSKDIARKVGCSVAQVNRDLGWILPKFEQALEEQAGMPFHRWSS